MILRLEKLTGVFRRRRSAGASDARNSSSKQRKKMTPEMIGLLIAAFLAVAAVIGVATKDAIIILYSSEIEGTRVHVDPVARILVSLTIPLIIALLVTIAVTLNGVTKDAKVQKAQLGIASNQAAVETRDKLADMRDQRAEQERAKIAQQAAATAAVQATINAKLQSEIAALRQDGAETREAILNLKRSTKEGVPVIERKKVIVATRSVKRPNLDTEDTRVFGINNDGTLSLLLVAHLFEGSAYWKYDSKVSFETKQGAPFPGFMQTIEGTPSLMQEFEGHDYVVGVGLGSHTQRKVPNIAKARARNLCGQLSALLGDQPKPQIFGMSIGDYTGSKKDTPTAPAREQRTALILGVRKTVAKDFSVSEVVEAILDSIGIPRVELPAYEGFKSGNSPTWYSVGDCGTGMTF